MKHKGIKLFKNYLIFSKNGAFNAVDPVKRPAKKIESEERAAKRRSCELITDITRRLNQEDKQQENVKHYQENRKNIRPQQSLHYLVNRDKILQTRARYYAENSDKILLQQTQYNQVNCEVISEKKKRFYEQHREELINQIKRYV